MKRKDQERARKERERAQRASDSTNEDPFFETTEENYRVNVSTQI